MKKFKNWLITNKKTLIQLLCWLIFMTCIILFIRYLENKNEENNKNIIDELSGLETMNNYLYECYYNDVTYTGKISNNKEEMYINENGIEKTLYYDNGWYEIVDSSRVDVEEYITRIKPNKIYEILKDSTFISKSEDKNFTRYKYQMEDGSELNVYKRGNEISAADLFGQYCAYNKIEGE